MLHSGLKIVPHHRYTTKKRREHPRKEPSELFLVCSKTPYSMSRGQYFTKSRPVFSWHKKNQLRGFSTEYLCVQEPPCPAVHILGRAPDAFGPSPYFVVHDFQYIHWPKTL